MAQLADGPGDGRAAPAEGQDHVIELAEQAKQVLVLPGQPGVELHHETHLGAAALAPAAKGVEVEQVPDVHADECEQVVVAGDRDRLDAGIEPHHGRMPVPPGQPV
jgi:hypothetical protein